jgi:ribosomal protein S1
MVRNIENWKKLQQKLKVGQVIKAKVIKLEPYGVYMDIGEKFHGIVLAPQIGRPDITFEEYPKIDTILDTIILAFSEFNGEHSYVSLSINKLTSGSTSFN